MGHQYQLPVHGSPMGVAWATNTNYQPMGDPWEPHGSLLYAQRMFMEVPWETHMSTITGDPWDPMELPSDHSLSHGTPMVFVVLPWISHVKDHTVGP